VSDPGSAFEAQLERAREVKQTHEVELLAKANVVGVGVGFRQVGGKPTRDVAIVVMVRTKVPLIALEPGDLLPDQIDGIPVDVQAVGEFSIHG
jgi:hypothetical protein